MTQEQLEEAIRINNEMHDLGKMRRMVQDKLCFKKTQPPLSPEVQAEGIDAMVAYIDERLDALKEDIEAI